VPKFRAKIEAARGGGAFVSIPDDVVKKLGGGGRIAVEASIDGVPYRGSIVSMGAGPCLGVLKAIRAQLGKDVGDSVTVLVERDDRPRTVDVPEDLAAALKKAKARAAFDALSFSHQREHVMWIEEAKRAETRARRVTQTVEGLI
jgi:Bacteriocin-protection, YdeI or OmpD-Associated/Domain of unknown function (DUF1905)